MRSLSIKLTLTIIFCTKLLALPNEYNSEQFSSYLNDSLNIFCAPESSKEPIKSLISNLDVFTCSTKAQEKDFCSCVSKVGSNLAKEKLEGITDDIKESLAKKYAKEYYEKDLLSKLSNKLEAIHNLQTLMPNLPKGCFTSLNPNASKTEKLLFKHELKLREKLQKNLSQVDSINQRIKFQDLADKVLTQNLGLYKSAVLERDLAYESNLYSSIGFYMATEGFALIMPKDAYGKPIAESDIWCNDEISAWEDIQKDVLFQYVDNGHNIPDGEDRLTNAIQNSVHFACESIIEEIKKNETFDDLGSTQKDRYMEEAKRFVQSQIASKNRAGLIKSMIEMKNEELSDSGKSLDDLEKSYYYDLAFCNMTGHDLTARTLKVQESIANNEEAIQEVMSDLEETDTKISQHQAIEEELAKNADLIEDAMARNPSESHENHIEDLARINILREQNQAAMNEQINLRNSHLQRGYDLVGGEENFLLYMSQTTANDISAPSRISIENDEIVVKTRTEYNQEIESFYEGQRSRVRNSQIYNFHSESGRRAIDEEIRKEKEELIDLNNSYLVREEAREKGVVSQSETSQLINEMDKNIKKEDILKEVGRIKGDALPEKGQSKLTNKIVRSKVKSNAIKVLPPIREDHQFGKVINTLSQRQKQTDSRIKRALEQLSNQRNIGTELEKKLASYETKDKKLTSTLKPIQESLKKTVENVERESQELERLKEKLLEKKQVQAQAQQVTTKKVISSAAKSLKRKTVAPQRRIVPKNSFSSTAVANEGISREIRPIQDEVVQPVELLKEELSSGTPILTLAEFSKYSTSEMKAKPINGTNDSFIVDIEGKEVLVKAINKDGKTVGYEVVNSVAREDLVKSLISDRKELLDIKGEIYKYDDFINLLNSSNQ